MFNKTISGDYGVPGWASAGLCFVQIRKIIELIALGCLVAHGDMPDTHKPKLAKSWDAGEVVGALQRLHKGFYPQPINVVVTPGNVHLDPVSETFLTKNRLVEVYGRCGNYLHRGSLKDFFGGKVTDVTPELNDYMSQIVRLIAVHRIDLIGKRRILLCHASHTLTGGAALVELITLSKDRLD